MSRYLLGRFGQTLLTLLVMSLLVFGGVYLVGNPVDLLLSTTATPAERLNVIQSFGLDKPVWEQYGLFVVNALHGDMGNSFIYNQPALHLIFQRMPATLELALVAFILALVIGIPLGVLPASGRGATVDVFGVPLSLFTADGLAHLILPAFNLALFKISLIIRLTRAGVLECLQQDFIRFARAKGLSESRIVLVHVLKNTLIPLITVIGLELGSLIAFAVVTETIYAWPGMGKLIIDSIAVLDRPVILAYLMITVVMFSLINLLVDVLYVLVDPRVRLGGEN